MFKTLCFPSVKTKEIFEKHMIEQIFLYHILTDTDSTSLFFVFACKPESKFTDESYRDSFSEIFALFLNEIYHQFDTSHEFWEKFSARNQELKRKLGYYEIEYRDGPCYVTVAVNPKEYIGKFESDSVTKKHKGLRKGAQNMKTTQKE